MENLEGYDRNSMALGMIEAFCEMVWQEVKPLALSPIMEPDQWAAIGEAVDTVAGRYSVRYFVEKPLMSSDLAPDESLEGKTVVLFYKYDEVLNSYIALKNESERLKSEKSFDGDARKKLSVSFRRLLGYPENVIAEHYSRRG